MEEREKEIQRDRGRHKTETEKHKELERNNKKRGDRFGGERQKGGKVEGQLSPYFLIQHSRTQALVSWHHPDGLLSSPSVCVQHSAATLEPEHLGAQHPARHLQAGPGSQPSSPGAAAWGPRLESTEGAHRPWILETQESSLPAPFSPESRSPGQLCSPLPNVDCTRPRLRTQNSCLGTRPGSSPINSLEKS
ncbi:Signal Peptide Peptidase-Like 2B [Manis pentadactyla]|nr:Signal Peptide Peptidase-Like 2B [Manis pentadactyla]